MTRLFVCASCVLLSVSTARAEITPNEILLSSFNPSDPVAPTSTVEGAGVKVGEGTVLRPVFGIETGALSNVFYEDAAINNTGVLRLLAQVGIASLGDARMTPPGEGDVEPVQGSFEYRADLRLAYDLMLTGNNTVSETGGLGIGASVTGLVNPRGNVAFQFQDSFDRLIRAANYETSTNTDRDINKLNLKLNFQPHDRSIGGYLYYTNMIDLFEREEQSFADRMFNRFGIHPSWRWLPQTLVYADVSLGTVSTLGDTSIKPNSYPLTARVGLATLISLKTTFNVDAGYTNGFYSDGPSYSAPTVGAQIGYRYSPLGRVTLGYSLVYEDSINANYYRDHVLRLSLQQLFAPFVIMAQPELHFRKYRGITYAVPSLMGAADTRDDVIFAVTAGIHYNFRNWVAATANYRFSTVQTDYMDPAGGTVDDPSYVRHELLVGMRMAL